MSLKLNTYNYTTRRGEMLDEIVFRHYDSHAPMLDVLNANPNIAKLGPVLPSGLTIVLPPQKVDEKKFITLWGD